MQQLNLKLTALLFAIVVLTQGCTSLRPPCAGFIEAPEYQSAPDHKAIAQYFDRDTQQPPAKLGEIPTECWYTTEAVSQKEANLGVMEACDNSLRELDKFTDWNCMLVVEGNQITLAERARLQEIAEISARSNSRRSYGTHVRPTPKIPGGS